MEAPSANLETLPPCTKSHSHHHQEVREVKEEAKEEEEESTAEKFNFGCEEKEGSKAEEGSKAAENEEEDSRAAGDEESTKDNMEGSNMAKRKVHIWLLVVATF